MQVCTSKSEVLHFKTNVCVFTQTRTRIQEKHIIFVQNARGWLDRFLVVLNKSSDFGESENMQGYPGFKDFIQKCVGAEKSAAQCVAFLPDWNCRFRWNYTSAFFLWNIGGCWDPECFLRDFNDFGESEILWTQIYSKETSWEFLVSEKSSAQCVAFCDTK